MLPIPFLPLASWIWSAASCIALASALLAGVALDTEMATGDSMTDVDLIARRYQLRREAVLDATIATPDVARLALGGRQAGVRVSADRGRTWTDLTAGLPAKNFFVLAFDPGVKGRLWASTCEEGTFCSDDLGLTWQNGGGAYGSDFIFIPVNRS